jgi:excisionase family DNA binding protein
MNDDVLTIREVADFLKVNEKTVYSLAQKRRIPGFKVGGQWRFRRGDLDAWIAAQTAETTVDGQPTAATRATARPARRKGRRRR